MTSNLETAIELGIMPVIESIPEFSDLKFQFGIPPNAMDRHPPFAAYQPSDEDIAYATLQAVHPVSSTSNLQLLITASAEDFSERNDNPVYGLMKWRELISRRLEEESGKSSPFDGLGFAAVLSSAEYHIDVSEPDRIIAGLLVNVEITCYDT